MDQVAAANFFIADRLRGIPLVSAGRKRSSFELESTGESQVQTTTAATTTTITTTGANVQVTTKRSLAEMVRGASGSKDRRPNGGTTKPRVAPPTSLPTRRQTTTTRRAQIQKLKQINNSPHNYKHKPTTTSTTTTKRPTSTRKPDRLNQGRAMMALEKENTPNRSSSVDYAINEQNTNNKLRRANQTRAIDFDYQRRNTQTVLTPRYTNKLNEMRDAGENWILFNRNDGKMSAFEILVLFSNIMIVSTIVFVILFNWFKSLKKRKFSLRGGKQEATEMKRDGAGKQEMVVESSSAINSRSPSAQQPIDGRSDVTRSLMSSAMSSGDGVKQQPPEETGEPVKKIGSAKNMSGMNIMVDGGQIGPSHDILSEVKGAANSIANKAMAIVQPTENTDAHSFSDTEKLTNAIKEELAPKNPNIKRSTSDISHESQKTKQSPLEVAAATAALAATATITSLPGKLETGGQPRKLEHLFEGPQSGPGEGQVSKEDKNAMSKKVRDGEVQRSNSQISASSLESIELPGPLIESIKRSDQRDPTVKEMPSPNLLLGEVEKNVEISTLPEAQTPTTTTTTIINDTNSNKIANVREQEKSKAKGSKVKASMEDPKSRPKVDQQSGKDENKSNNSGLAKQKKADLSERPANPMGREETGLAKASGSIASADMGAQARVSNHQVVVNKLDKRKTNLEIVDLRDESVTGKMRDKSTPTRGKEAEDGSGKRSTDESANWISMDGVAVVQTPTQLAPAGTANQQTIAQQQQPQTINQAQVGQQQAMSPSEIIESRFHVDYGSKKKKGDGQTGPKGGDHKGSQDSKSERESLGNIETELELLNNKMKNRKYFVYIVNDGHFTAKKECIARIELPPKRRITLAEMRQLITNSQDISLSSLRRNKFKFVTETYRLLNENEDAAVLHQVYPTQGVFLKLNVPEQESQNYPYKGTRGRLSSSSGPGVAPIPSSLSQTTISSRRRVATRRTGADQLPAIEVNYAIGDEPQGYPRTRAASVGRRGNTGGSRAAPKTQQGAYRRSKSSVQTAPGRRQGGQQRMQNKTISGADHSLPSIDLLDELPDDLVGKIDRRSSFTSASLADMSDHRMRIKPRWKNCG